jgi:integrase
MKIKITVRVIERMKPGDRISDTEVPGFECRRYPTGRVSFFCYHRTRDGQQRRPKLGNYPVLLPEHARQHAREMLADAYKGHDPSLDRQRRREAPTMNELFDRYLAEHVELHNKPSTRDEMERIVQKRLRPEFGSRKVPAVTREEIQRFHHALRETKTEANRALAALSKAFSLASRVWNMRPDNPCLGIRRYPETRRERFLSDEELGRLGAALDAAVTQGTAAASVVAVIRLLLYTGCRLGEVVPLRWEHVDLAEGAIHLPDAKTGARTVALSQPAKTVLTGQTRARDVPWVFTRPGTVEPISIWMVEAAWQTLRASAKLQDARLHDLRHTFATYGSHTGANAFLLQHALGHKTLEMTRRYVSRATAPLRPLVDSVGSRIENALSGNCARSLAAPLKDRSA